MLGPQGAAIGGTDQLRGDAHRVAGVAHAALQQVRDAEPGADGACVVLAVAELERGVAPDHLQPVDLRQRIDQVLRQAVGELHLVLVAAGVGRSEEHTSELQSLMRISSAVFCLKTKKKSHYYDNQLLFNVITQT